MLQVRKLKIRWVKSAIGYSKRQKATIRALGLHRLGQVVEQADSPVIRGMVAKVGHLVEVEELAGGDQPAPTLERGTPMGAGSSGEGGNEIA
jgi:large subunit ribosomal protein L30